MARILLTGPPGSGKTTVVQRAVHLLRERGEQLAGFTTTEIRRGGRRTGFVITGMNGLERVLAKRASGPHMVGPYAVDVSAFEEVALLEIENGLELGTTLIVDEIAKMELLSDRFRELVPAIFDAPHLLATVPVHGEPMIENAKSRDDVQVITVLRDNSADLAPRVCDWVLDAVPDYSSR